MFRLALVCALGVIVGCGNAMTTDENQGGEGGGAGEGGQGNMGGGFAGSAGAMVLPDGGASDVAGAGGKQVDAGVSTVVDAATSQDAAFADAGNSVEELPPTNRKDLEAWIAKGFYKKWKCEASVMNARPNGAHGRNRVCSNALARSHGAGPYPVGAASVKELYSNNNIVGYAASVKVKAGVAANTWYWYEGGIEGIANPSCAGCHSLVSNYGGHDYVYIQVK